MRSLQKNAQTSITVDSSISEAFAAVVRAVTSLGHIGRNSPSTGIVVINLPMKMFPVRNAVTVQISLKKKTETETTITLDAKSTDGLIGFDSAAKGMNEVLDALGVNKKAPNVTEDTLSDYLREYKENLNTDNATPSDTKGSLSSGTQLPQSFADHNSDAPDSKSDSTRTLAKHLSSCFFCNRRKPSKEHLYQGRAKKQVRQVNTGTLTYRYVTKSVSREYLRCSYCADSHATDRRFQLRGLVASIVLGTTFVCFEFMKVPGWPDHWGLPNQPYIRFAILTAVALIPLGVSWFTGEIYQLIRGTSSIQKAKRELARLLTPDAPIQSVGCGFFLALLLGFVILIYILMSAAGIPI